ncbi:MAG: hypothetical protein GEU77_20205 [Deltaproteobacteria bacterium]|nr:hypothetical protein [Deltaproteobacteria bacterium]
MDASTMVSTFVVRAEQDALIISFPARARALSWAIVNGGFCYADHVINHRVRGNDPAFCAQPGWWLKQAAMGLGLQGKIVAMATAVEMKNLARISLSDGVAEVTCFATVGCGNALSVGDPASVAMEERALAPLHTINMILTAQPGLPDEAMVEAIQIVTEARVRALYEAGIQSSVSSLLATGTGTDCIAIVSLDCGAERYCGKHTKLGELIGLAAYTAVKNGLAQSSTTKNGAAPGGNSHDT